MELPDSEDGAYDLGAQAYADGEPIADNPYPAGVLADAWEEGWTDEESLYA